MLFTIAVDCIVIAYNQQVAQLQILLVNRVNEPARGKWALPGGFVNETEEFVDTAKRKLRQETGVRDVYLEQLQAYSLTDESAQDRIASVAYYALINFESYAPDPASTHPAQWFPLQQIPSLPFDHGQKVRDTVTRIKETIKFRPIHFHLLPVKFPLNQLQKFYEEIYSIKLDNRNFRKWIKGLPYVEALAESETNVSHRPGKLYHFNQKKHEELSASTHLMPY